MVKMQKCQLCKSEFPSTYYDESGIRHICTNRKFCFNCSPLYGHNTTNFLQPRKRPEDINFIQNVSKDEKLAELIGILLGDGCIYINKQNNYSKYFVYIYFNKYTDIEAIENVKQLWLKVFGVELKSRDRESECILRNSRYSREVIETLINIGLVAGNKVKNQVGVPNWIKENKEYSIACLRGLIDTDGSIYFNKANGQISVSFCNHSLNLLNDFRILCKIVGFEPYYNGKYVIMIGNKKGATEFIEIVKPLRWQSILRRNPDMKNNIKYKNSREFKSITKELLEILVWEKLIVEIANTYKTKYKTIKRICDNWQIKRPPKGYWAKIVSQKHQHKKMFEVNKEELQKLVWTFPTEYVGKRFGVSGKAIEKRCKLLGITKPPRGYWAKVNSTRRNYSHNSR